MTDETHQWQNLKPDLAVKRTIADHSLRSACAGASGLARTSCRVNKSQNGNRLFIVYRVKGG
jgi:hypothetical protein